MRERRFNSGSLTEGWNDEMWVQFPLLTLASEWCGCPGLLVDPGDRVIRDYFGIPFDKRESWCILVIEHKRAQPAVAQVTPEEIIMKRTIARTLTFPFLAAMVLFYLWAICLLGSLRFIAVCFKWQCDLANGDDVTFRQVWDEAWQDSMTYNARKTLTDPDSYRM